ncbi:MAG TPA: hypothetical protein DCM64_05335 [Gammaproteobacteria bacterium]|jgi:hypothetical protein|nr:hypothetical protein [Gammaproteobacteria bacterium]
MPAFIRYNYRSIILILPLAFTACLNRVDVTFLSEPEGATITEVTTGIEIGIAPISRSYDLGVLSPVDPQGCYSLVGVEAQWISGATSRVQEFQLCGDVTEDYYLTLERPAEHPDLDKDVQHARSLRVSRERLRRENSGQASFQVTPFPDNNRN